MPKQSSTSASGAVRSLGVFLTLGRPQLWWWRRRRHYKSEKMSEANFEDEYELCDTGF